MVRKRIGWKSLRLPVDSSNEQDAGRVAPVGEPQIRKERTLGGTIKEDTQPPAPILRCRSRSALCPGRSPGSLAVRAKTLLGLFDSAQRANVKRAAPARAVTIYLVADIPVVAFPGQLRDKPNGPGRRASAARDPAGRVGAGSCTGIGDPGAVGAVRGPGRA